MLKNLLILSSFMILTACQSLPVKNIEIKKAELTTPKVIVDSDHDGVPDNIDKCPNTPLNVVVDAKGCPAERYTNCYEPPTLRVFFNKNDSYPKDQYLPELKKVAELMTEYPKATFAIEGHASKAEKNPEKISHERAIVLAQILKEKYGINEKRIIINSYGSKRPIAPNTTEEGQKMNQRIYAVINY